MRVFLVFLVCGFSLNLQAEETSAEMPTTVSSDLPSATGPRGQGIRLAIYKPSYNMSWKIRTPGKNYSSRNDMRPESVAGGSIGYVHFPARKVGFGVNLGVADIEQVYQLYRLQGDFGYSVNDTFVLRAGPNLTTAQGVPGPETADPGIGFAVGMDLQMNQNFGVMFQYADMEVIQNREGRENIHYTFSGFEFGLTATF